MKYSVVFAAGAVALPVLPALQQITLSSTNIIDQVFQWLPDSSKGSTKMSGDTLEQSGVPSVEEAARVARTLVHRESLATMVTVNSDNIPEGYVEYYADCGSDGNPVMLNVHIGTGFRNIAAGSKVTLSVRVGDHPVTEKTNPVYPGGIVRSTAGSPRVSMRGEFKDLDKEEIEAVQECFLARHPDAKWWLPGNNVHATSWVKFDVSSLHMVGGFGDRAFIGTVPGDVYRAAKIIHHKHHGDTKDVSREEILAAHAGLSGDKAEFLKAHSGEAYEAAVANLNGEKFHKVDENHGKSHKTLAAHAALSDDPKAFMEAHSGDVFEAAKASGEHHKVDKNHGKGHGKGHHGKVRGQTVDRAAMLEMHAELSGNKEAFLKAHENSEMAGASKYHSEKSEDDEDCEHARWMRIHNNLL